MNRASGELLFQVTCIVVGERVVTTTLPGATGKAGNGGRFASSQKAYVVEPDPRL
jgi:hypothetical protein